MLWTRAVPATGKGGPVRLLLELDTERNFSCPLLRAPVQTDADADYTVRAYVDGLTPDTRYYYRFLGGGTSVSRVGRTHTAPAPGQATRVNLAFTSCQSFEQAHYGSWARMLAEDRAADEQERIHFVLHLGDFIYERCWRRRVDGSPQARTVPPFPDGTETAEYRYAVSLADYRHLYKTYLSDPHLQAARANWPFVCTWDDHEFSNDSFQAYSTYGDSARLEAERRQHANQAWFEYVPAVLSELSEREQQPAHDFRPQIPGPGDAAKNRAALDSLCIYRKLGWGKHLDIVLTDSRSYRSPPCVPPGLTASLGLPLNTVELVAITDGGTAYNDGNPPDTLPYGEGTVPNPARHRAPGTMLGLEQRAWFLETLASSGASWKLWGNALPLIPMRLDLSSLPFADYEDAIYNIDGWEGYPHEVGVLMRHLEEKGITGVVSLSGDHHLHGAGTVNRSASDPGAPPVVADFTVAGISSSPVFEDVLAAARDDHPDFGTLVFRETDGGLEPVWQMSLLDGVLAASLYSRTGMYSLARWLGPNPANPGLRYLDTTCNGYGLASFDTGEARVQFVALEDCRGDFTEAPAIRYTAGFRLPLWRPGEPPGLAGPEFSGVAPFPFSTPDA
jgi:alkaline phosphatase D